MDCLALSLGIWEAVGSNLGREPAVINNALSGPRQPLQREAGTVGLPYNK